MGLKELIGKALPLKGMLELLIGYLSNLLELIAPGEITPEAKAQLQKFIPPVYALAKSFGVPLVNSTENDLDNVTLNEFVEICEIAAKKYGIELNAVVLPNA